MNPGLLNKRLQFDTFTIWGKKNIKIKRRDDEQNEELYDFIVRKRDIKEYSSFSCENIKYNVLAVDEYQKEKGYLLLKCEKARLHSFYDTCTISRLVDADIASGATRQNLVPVYTEIPCELIRQIASSASESEQENKLDIRYEVYLENSISVLIGDEMVITHQSDNYKATIQNYFRTHTYQIIQIKLDGEA